jgi:hypothetical protein
MLGCPRFSSLSGVALVHIGQLDVPFRDLPHLPGQFADLCAILLVVRAVFVDSYNTVVLGLEKHNCFRPTLSVMT